jgi:hypothetical protein
VQLYIFAIATDKLQFSKVEVNSGAVNLFGMDLHFTSTAVTKKFR